MFSWNLYWFITFLSCFCSPEEIEAEKKAREEHEAKVRAAEDAMEKLREEHRKREEEFEQKLKAIEHEQAQQNIEQELEKKMQEKLAAMEEEFRRREQEAQDRGGTTHEMKYKQLQIKFTGFVFDFMCFYIFVLTQPSKKCLSSKSRNANSKLSKRR